MNFMKSRNIARLLRRMFKGFLKKDILLFPDCRIDFELLGTDYGSWPVINSIIQDAVVIYSFGIGDDISWDLAIIEKFKVKVHAFDPTSKCKLWLNSIELPHDFVYHDIGLSDHNGFQEFVPPDNEKHVSFSIVKKDSEKKSEMFKVSSLDQIMKCLGHQVINVLKMDIEGAEYNVLNDMMTKNIFPCVLMVEFHHRFVEVGMQKTIDTVSTLKTNGYCIFYVSPNGEEIGFIQKSAVE